MTRQKISIIGSIVLLLFISACSNSENDDYRELSWENLEPVQELTSEDNEMIGSLEINDDWSESEQALGGGLRDIYAGTPQQNLSSEVVSELDGTNIKVPGYVVPIEFDGENMVTEFFLVPYFGACFHKPPPPPNQTIYVKSSKPVKYESIYDPVWITGLLSTEITGNDVATSAYTMNLHQIMPFEY